MEDIKIETKKAPIKKPEEVIGFLREFNFGSKNDQSDQAVIRDFIEYVKIRNNEKLLPNEPSWADLLATELEKTGFAEPGTLSHETWSLKHEQALNKVLESL